MQYTAVIATLVAGVFTQSTRTISAMVPFSATYTGSIVAVTGETTTFQAWCDGSGGCPSGESHMVVLAGTTNLVYNTNVDYFGDDVVGMATCDIMPTTSANCQFIATSVNVDTGETTTISLSTTSSATRLPYATLVVTEGAEKLPQQSPSGTSGGSSRGTSGATAIGNGVAVTAISLASAFIGLAIFL